MVDKIIDVLAQILKAHEEIYELSGEKQRQIKEDKAQELQETVKKEWVLLSRASGLEEQREKFARELTGSDAENVTISDIKEAATPEQAEKLDELAAQLREILSRQKYINEENQALIELHLEYVDFMANMFLKEPQVSNIYGNAGTEVDVGTDKGIIDNEA